MRARRATARRVSRVTPGGRDADRGLTLVADASVVTAALVDSGRDAWAEQILASDDRAAPHLMPWEVANILRRSVLAREISEDTAALAARLATLDARLRRAAGHVVRSSSRGRDAPAYTQAAR
jgi:hypothetical protein